MHRDFFVGFEFVRLILVDYLLGVFKRPFKDLTIETRLPRSFIISRLCSRRVELLQFAFAEEEGGSTCCLHILKYQFKNYFNFNHFPFSFALAFSVSLHLHVVRI